MKLALTGPADHRRTRDTGPAEVVSVPMTEAEARSAVTFIARSLREGRAKTLELHDRLGWQALGYPSWGACVEAEFAQSRQHVHRMLQAARAEQLLGVTIGDNPESHLRPIQQLTTDEQRSVLAEADEVAQAAGRPRQARDVTEAAQRHRDRAEADEQPPEAAAQPQPYQRGIPRGLQAQAEQHGMTVARMDDGGYTLIDDRGYGLGEADTLTAIAAMVDKQIRVKTWGADRALLVSLRDRAEALGVIWDGIPDKKGRYTLLPPGRPAVKGTIYDLIDHIDRWEQNKSLTEVVRPQIDSDNPADQYLGALEIALSYHDRLGAGTAAMALAINLLGLNGNNVLECLETVLTSDQWDRLSQAI